jgi:aldose 1-epimerase
MSIVEISDVSTGSRAVIAVNAGFNCFSYVARKGDEELNVITAEDGFEDGTKRPSHNGVPILFPFPNRIRSGRFSWDGKEYELPESLVSYDGSGNAIHGFCLDRPWRVADQSESSVTGVFRLSVDAEERAHLWPSDAELRVQYEVRGTTLHCRFTVLNPDTKPLPWGLGTHSYFRLPLSDSSNPDECTVFAPVEKSRELIDCLPTGKTGAISLGMDLATSPKYGTLKLDNAFSGMKTCENSQVETFVADPASGRKVIQRFSADFQELVAFTPPWTSAVCLEPYTCTTDAINLQQQGIEAGLRILEPNETWTGIIDIEAIL